MINDCSLYSTNTINEHIKSKTNIYSVITIPYNHENNIYNLLLEKLYDVINDVYMRTSVNGQIASAKAQTVVIN